MTIGARINCLRKKKGYTQEYIAEQLHVTRQAVSKWEQDQTSPDTWNLIELAKLLETSVEYITLGEEEKKSHPPIPTKSYCGKSCELCEQKTELDCSGCKGGTPWNPQLRCEISVCCHSKSHKSCNLCTQSSNCRTLRQRDLIPSRWLQNRKAEKELAQLREKVLNGCHIWIGILPYVAVLYALTTYVLGNYAPISSTVSGIAYASLLLILYSQSDSYKTAGILLLISTALRLAGCYLPDPATIIVNLPFAILRIFRMRSEFSGHETISTHFDLSIAETYTWLWKGYWIIPLWELILVIIGYILHFNLLIQLAVIGGGIASIILEISHIYNLFMLKKLFVKQK